MNMEIYNPELEADLNLADIFNAARHVGEFIINNCVSFVPPLGFKIRTPIVDIEASLKFTKHKREMCHII